MCVDVHRDKDWTTWKCGDPRRVLLAGRFQDRGRVGSGASAVTKNGTNVKKMAIQHEFAIVCSKLQVGASASAATGIGLRRSQGWEESGGVCRLVGARTAKKKSQRTDNKELVAKTGVRTGEKLSTRDGRRRCLPQFEELWLEARICPLRSCDVPNPRLNNRAGEGCGNECRRRIIL